MTLLAQILGAYRDISKNDNEIISRSISVVSWPRRFDVSVFYDTMDIYLCVRKDQTSKYCLRKNIQFFEVGEIDEKIYFNFFFDGFH